MRPVDKIDLANLRPWLLRYVRSRRRGIPHRDREDVVQDIFVAALRRWETFVPSSSQGLLDLRRWVSGIARNTVLMYQRYERTHPVSYGHSDKGLEVPSHEGAMEARSEARMLRKSIGEERWQFLLDLVDSTAAELAEQRGESVSTIQWRAREARKALARAIANETW